MIQVRLLYTEDVANRSGNSAMQSTVNIEQSIIENLRQLPLEKQQEVLDFSEFLRQKTTPKQSRRSIKGLCADLNIHTTEEDIAEARREMWGNFPREFPE
jgi:Protein of unknown function (DUF2281)